MNRLLQGWRRRTAFKKSIANRTSSIHTKLRRIWRDLLTMNNSAISQPYVKTSVLLLGWANDEKDTDTDGELSKLRATFEDTYGFDVRYHRMHQGKHPQVQATKHVADFVLDEDGKDRLLIVYYSGHGTAGHDNASNKKKLLLSGPGQKMIDWAEVEPTLRKAQADVLVVLDCCYAGLMCRSAARIEWRNEKFQYMAACEADEMAQNGGEGSFASSMALALEKLAGEPGFTTSRLLETLERFALFDPTEQQPRLYGARFGMRRPDIWIAPSAEKQRSREAEAAEALLLLSQSGGHAKKEKVETTAEENTEGAG